MKFWPTKDQPAVQPIPRKRKDEDYEQPDKTRTPKAKKEGRERRERNTWVKYQSEE